MWIHRCTLAAFALAAAAMPLPAQDTRTVHEPVLPPVCTTLKAEYTRDIATSGQLEDLTDTAGRTGAVETRKIQAALDTCGPGKAVRLAVDGEKNAFLTGPLVLRPGVTLLVDKGITLYGSREPKDYELSPGSCGLVSDLPRGCKPLLTAVKASGSGIMGDGVIDGQGGAKILVNGRPGAKSWWDLAEDARKAGRQQVPRLIDTDATNDFTLYRITLRNSANFHVAFHHGDGFTAWAVKIDTPKSARNTDGIDPAGSQNVTITQSFIRTGDDNIAIKGGDEPSTNITISHNHFYWGHGLSIGSETNAGVSQVRVDDLTLDGPDNGLRIKSNAERGGLVRDIRYDDVCIRDAKNPILLDTTYTLPGNGVQSLPVYEDIVLHDVRILGGGKIQSNGYDATHRIGVTFDGVLLLDDAVKYRLQATHTDIHYGPGPVNLPFAGDDSTVTGKAVDGRLPSCNGRFVPFPAP